MPAACGPAREPTDREEARNATLRALNGNVCPPGIERLLGRQIWYPGQQGSETRDSEPAGRFRSAGNLEDMRQANALRKEGEFRGWTDNAHVPQSLALCC
jgi:hypothetical protein